MQTPWMVMVGSNKLIISGIIGEWPNDQDSMQMDFQEIMQSGISDLEVIINSKGGDVFGGFAIYEQLLQLRNMGVTITTKIQGLAASMASMIALAASPGKVEMSSTAFYMIHLPSTQVSGNETALEKAKNMLEKITTTSLDVYAQKTDLARKDLETMMAEETWMTAEEALEKGFIDKILNEGAKPKAVTPLTVDAVFSMAAETIKKEFTQIKPRKMTNPQMIALAIALGLDQNANADEVNARAVAILKDNTTLKADAKAAKDALQAFKDAEAVKVTNEVTLALDQAVTDRKITAEQKASFMTLAEADAPAVLKIVGDMKALPSVSSQIGGIATLSQEEAAKRADWGHLEWSKEDPKGLATIYKDDKPLFEKLMVKSYGETS